jgi:hypothetical protein
MMIPATWATKVVAKTSGGRASYELSDDFSKEWVRSVDPALFIHRWQPRLVYPEREFEHYIAALAHARVDVAELLKRRVYGRVETIKYDPGLEPGVHSSADNKNFFKVFWPKRFDPFKSKPDLSPWHDYLATVFPHEADRKELIRWVASREANLDTVPIAA